MIRTMTNTHRLGQQPSRARVDRAIGRCAATHRSATWTYVARQANSTDASAAVSAFDGILAVPTMWTKWPARHLAPRST